MRAVSIRITGKVQGVFFRATAKEKADEFHVRGNVRNNADGSLSILAEGEEKEMEQFITWCKKGPRFARVDHCEIIEVPLKHFSRFVIER